MLGLKRDLRMENENIIYPQEVSPYQYDPYLDSKREKLTRKPPDLPHRPGATL